MEDITSTTFGLAIAYLVPGIVGLSSSLFFFSKARLVAGQFAAANADVGLFLIIVLLALGVGVWISAVRWLLFEKCFLKRHCPAGLDYQKLGQEGTREAVKTAVEENYRYHQFFGNLLVASVPFVIGCLYYKWGSISKWHTCMQILLALAYIVFVLISFAAARDALVRYCSRSKELLGA